MKSSFELNLPSYLIIPSSSIKLNETIGQGIQSIWPSSNLSYSIPIVLYSITLGEFGIVYKGYIRKSDSHLIEEYLAIKTLKGMLAHTLLPRNQYLLYT